MKGLLRVYDRGIIKAFRRLSMPAARVALFLVFFGFGFLKVIQESPADELVRALLGEMVFGVPFSSVFIGLGVYEMVLGLVFLIPGSERLAIAMLLPHITATFLPLFIVPDMVWISTLLPTLEGQYILKNVAIVALGITVAANIHAQKRMRG